MSPKVLLAFVAMLLPFIASHILNPVPYTISNPPPAFAGKTYPFIGEYFDVETDVLPTQYSQVYWQTMRPILLPANIISRFQNTSIAVTGFEVDVRRRNPQTGVEESVPAYQSYNHHYSPNIISSLARLRLDANGQPMGEDHGHGKMLEVVLRDDAPTPPPDAQLNQGFVHGNGQEHRQLYHGFPKGYVQTVYAPDTFVLTPMQISTNDGTGRKSAGGPLPRYSQKYAPADAPYSPLLECPCTTRITKKFGNSVSVVDGVCSKAFLESDCFAAAARSLGKALLANTTINSLDLPSGCLITRVAVGKDFFNAVFNTNPSSRVPCQQMSDPTKNHILGSQSDLVTLVLDVDGTTNIVKISISGPSQYWFGVGFNATIMNDLPYAIIVDGNGNVQERKLANHDPGRVIQSSVKVVSNTVLNGVRTVLLQRALAGVTPDHYSFSPTVATIKFINALGDTVDFTQHKFRSSAVIELFNNDITPSCLCSDPVETINGIPYDADCKPEPLSDLLADNNPTCQVSSYVGGLACCINGGLLLDADQTPPAFVDKIFFIFRFYFEDYDPTKHQVVRHVEWSQNGCDSGAGGPNPYGCRHIEYDIVKGVGSAAGPDIQTFQSTFPAHGMFETSCRPTDGQCMDGSKVGPKGFKLITAATHCHAPNCLRQELINLDTGKPICIAIPIHGQSENLFDEKGYLFAPPCTWGDSVDEGFFPPPILQMNTNLQMVTYYNSTYGHTGQMGIWQMKAAYIV